MGWYTDGAGNQQPLLETESNGTWSAQEGAVPGPASPQSDPYSYLDSLSCSSRGNCVAVGQFDDSSGAQQGLVESESHGSWSASELDLSQLPSVYTSDPAVELTSVACPTAGSCVVTGQYSDSADKQQGLIASETNGIWTTHEANLSALSLFINPEVNLLALSCASPGNCAAGGDYLDSSGYQQALLMTETNGAWAASSPDLSQLSAASDPDAQIESVSCPAAGSCSAVGYFEDNTFTYQGLLVNEAGGAWQPATEAQLPANAAGETAAESDLYLASVDCASIGNCTAVGTYDSTSANDVEGLELTENGGNWAPSLETNLPAASSSNPDVWLASVSCVTARHCVAAGSFDGSDGNNQALVVRQSGDSWTSDSVEEPTTYNRFNSNGASISCIPGYCADGGYTLTATSPVHNGALLLATPAAVSNLSAAAGTDSSAHVTWTATSDSTDLPVTYLVTANDLSDHDRGGQTVSVSGATTATFTSLTPMDTYTFTVRPSNLLGAGPAVTTANVTLPPLQRWHPPVRIPPRVLWWGWR